jgi:hypothetical protein
MAWRARREYDGEIALALTQLVYSTLMPQLMSALGQKQTSRFIQSPRQQAAGAYQARRDLAL